MALVSIRKGESGRKREHLVGFLNSGIDRASGEEWSTAVQIISGKDLVVHRTHRPRTHIMDRDKVQNCNIDMRPGR